MSAAKTIKAAGGAGRGGAQPPPLGREDAARYVAALTADLAEMARRSDLGLVSYFLELARAEAKAIVEAERRADRTGREGA